MADPKISSETVVGVALTKLGITYFAFATADHSEDWFKSYTRRKLAARFGSLFPRTYRKDPTQVVVVVDKSYKQYVVADMDELERVWRANEIAYAFTMPKDTFETLRGNIAITPVPA